MPIIQNIKSHNTRCNEILNTKDWDTKMICNDVYITDDAKNKHDKEFRVDFIRFVFFFQISSNFYHPL